ncbi:MAG: type II secretion system protein [Phycisphaerae bacterium]|nr:type II secretion system protein [Phycisphaerae bacterium]
MTRKNKKGFTLIEIIVVIAIMGILMVALSRVAISIKTKTQVKATEAVMRQVIDALQAYVDGHYGKNTGEFEYPYSSYTGGYKLDGKLVSVPRIVPYPTIDAFPDSRQILDSISDEFKKKQNIIVILDAWKTPLLYELQTDGNFPTLRSAGPDMIFGTVDDIVSTDF